MDNSNSIMQQRRSSIKLYTEFSQNYPAVHNLPIQIDNSSHSIRSIIIPSMIMQSTGIQTMNMTPEVSVQVDLLTQQSEFTQTDLEVDNNPPILLDATSESSVNIENSTDPLNRIMGLPCFHMFHYTCLYAWIDKNLQCPMCRMPIYEID
ncbi:uncharacterized protein DC041_0003502 [Schistosoma bovis]|uniref:RING-type domain-containing protein n=1 Tax=Schistosoma bovis TaxID=6184 RepID=A0A430Q9F3_SCHBO|nr:uncharacterized protein DC041_0003502 [Schistosoma bovis]